VEARADTYALELTRDPRTMIGFQRRIAVSNVADPSPPGWAAFLLDTHPSTMQRIGAAVAFRRRAEAAARADRVAARRPTPGGS
jgi:STE24 endopeptidase